MSFTSDVKYELCKMNIHNKCCAIAECYGFMLYANQFDTGKIKVYSDNQQVRKRLFLLLKKSLGEVYMIDDGSGAVVIDDKRIIEKIYNAFGYEYKNTALHLNRAVIEEDCCKNAFIRGAFLASGYISEQSKGYHLELVTTHYGITSEVLLLLNEMDFSTKAINRRGNYVIYYKDSEAIEKLLAAMGATNSAMELMLKKVERNLRNNINRKVNCETSNLSKIADAAALQLEAINILKENGTFESLPKPLKDAANLRIENPEMNLTEIGKLCCPPITKPGISGRMRKIIKLAKEF